MKIMVTGANGFVGTTLCSAILANGYRVTAITRNEVGDISRYTNWNSYLKGIDTVVHLAARVHVMKDTANDPLTAFRQVNVQGTLNLAQQAATSGVKRFIFISSVKVNGENTQPNNPFKADDAPNPTEPYSISKWEAEIELRSIAADTGMSVMVIRPPLVYGPGVKANFYSLMRWVNLGIPLPLSGIHNKRSFIALDNLISVIIRCIQHSSPIHDPILVSDGEDVSTPDLIRRIAYALDKPARLIPVPANVIEKIAGGLGKDAVAQRLINSLQVDISKTQDILDWKPLISLDEGIRRTVNHFLAC